MFGIVICIVIMLLSILNVILGKSITENKK